MHNYHCWFVVEGSLCEKPEEKEEEEEERGIMKREGSILLSSEMQESSLIVINEEARVLGLSNELYSFYSGLAIGVNDQSSSQIEDPVEIEPLEDKPAFRFDTFQFGIPTFLLVSNEGFLANYTDEKDEYVSVKAISKHHMTKRKYEHIILNERRHFFAFSHLHTHILGLSFTLGDPKMLYFILDDQLQANLSTILSQPLRVDAAVFILAVITDIVGFFHKRGFMHRFVFPFNFLLG
jgi:serine/threonine protein kinase